MHIIDYGGEVLVTYPSLQAYPCLINECVDMPYEDLRNKRLRKCEVELGCWVTKLAAPLSVQEDLCATQHGKGLHEF